MKSDASWNIQTVALSGRCVLEVVGRPSNELKRESQVDQAIGQIAGIIGLCQMGSNFGYCE